MEFIRVLFRSPADLTGATGQPAVREILDGEQRLFDGRRNAVSSQLQLLDRRVAKAHEEIAALLAQQRSDRRQLAIINEEIASVRELYEKGLERKPRLLALQRAEAELEGSIDNREALMARAAQTVAETEFQKVGLRESTTAEIETDLRAVQVELRSEEHTSELQSLMRISYAVICLKKHIQTIHNIQV